MSKFVESIKKINGTRLTENESLISRAREYIQNGGAYNASMKNVKEYILQNPNAKWSDVKAVCDESHAEETMDADHDVDSVSKKYGESKEQVSEIFSDAISVALLQVEEKIGEKFQTVDEAKRFVEAIIEHLNGGKTEVFNKAFERFQRMRGRG